MYLLLKIIQLCLIKMIIQVQDATSYVLLAADIEDFRTIAKKFVPAELADQLTNIASQSAKKQRESTYDSYSSEYSENEDYETTPVTVQQKIKRNSKPKFKIQEHLSKININDVVEKVQETLAKEYAHKYKETTQSKQYYVYVPKGQNKRQNVDYDEDTTRHTVRTTRQYKSRFRDTEHYSGRSKKHNDSTPSYNKWHGKEEEFEKTNVKVKKEINDDDKGKGEFFRQIDLTNTKDSYEDYVTPKKEDIFSSAETTKKNIVHRETRFIKVKNKSENIISSTLKNVGQKIIRSSMRTTPQYDYEDEHEAAFEDNNEKKQEPEIKARTESLLYDERYQSSDINGPTNLKGTIIPKIDYYKLSSPKYSTVPNVAEKYDFNEPIPERDREPESISKPIGNPSALVNKKVRLV